MKTTIALLSALAFSATLSLAQDGPPPPDKKPGGPGGPGGRRFNPEAVFKKLDTNSDGSLSLDEFKASPRAQKAPDKAEEMYKKLDADSDGKVTLEEFKAGRPARPARRAKGGDAPAEQ